MRINGIEITNVGGIKHLSISFQPQMNLICGPNGNGKTTLIESIAHVFAHGGSVVLKRNVNSEKGVVKSELVFEKNILKHSIEISDFAPKENKIISGLHTHAKYVLSFKVNRTFAYQALSSVAPDHVKAEHDTYNEARTGLNISEIKNWFVNRYMFAPHPDQALSPNKQHNFELAKHCISILNPDYKFKNVNATTFDIMVSTPDGDIYYEYLSSGFKSCLAMLFGIIKEIEFRFTNPDIKADEFDGIIIIDELEIHLHPEWQARITGILKTVFPKVQFIATTHSPHVIQHAEKSEIIALGRDRVGNVCLLSLPESEFGYKGWSIEEVLTDVMGMRHTMTDIYSSYMRDFGEAIDSENYLEAKRLLESLDKMLHPDNYMRKLMKLQLASIQERHD